MPKPCHERIKCFKGEIDLNPVLGLLIKCRYFRNSIILSMVPQTKKYNFKQNITYSMHKFQSHLNHYYFIKKKNFRSG